MASQDGSGADDSNGVRRQGRSRLRSRGLYTTSEKYCVPEHIRLMMCLADLKTNERGGSSEFTSMLAAATACCPEQIQNDLSNIPFQPNSPGKHAAAIDALIRKCWAIQRPPATPQLPQTRGEPSQRVVATLRSNAWPGTDRPRNPAALSSRQEELSRPSENDHVLKEAPAITHTLADDPYGHMHIADLVMTARSDFGVLTALGLDASEVPRMRPAQLGIATREALSHLQLGRGQDAEHTAVAYLRARELADRLHRRALLFFGTTDEADAAVI